MSGSEAMRWRKLTLRPVLHLLAGDAQGLVVFLLVDEAEELSRTRHVAALAHVDKIVLRLHLQHIQPGEAEHLTFLGRHMQFRSLHQAGESRDVLVRGAATSAEDVHQAFIHERLHLGGHLVGRLVVLPQAVGQAGIGIDADVIGRAGGELLQIGLHLTCAERAVQTHGKRSCVLHGGQEGIQRLPGEGASAFGDGDGKHQGDFPPRASHRLAGGMDGGLGIERVEDGLHQQGIHPTLQQGAHLLDVGFGELVEGEGTQGGIVHVGAHREGLVGGAHGACHVAGLLRGAPGIFIGQGACQAGGLKVDVAHMGFRVVIRLADARGVEGVGLDDVRPRLQVAPVDVRHHVGAGEAQEVVVSLQGDGRLGKERAAEVGFREAAALYHGAHGAVQDEEAPADGFGEGLHGVRNK